MLGKPNEPKFCKTCIVILMLHFYIFLFTTELSYCYLLKTSKFKLIFISFIIRLELIKCLTDLIRFYASRRLRLMKF